MDVGVKMATRSADFSGQHISQYPKTASKLSEIVFGYGKVSFSSRKAKRFQFGVMGQQLGGSLIDALNQPRLSLVCEPVDSPGDFIQGKRSQG